MSVNRIVGTVENLQERQASGGREYVLVRLVGEETGFFDWDGKLASVQVGDQVELEHGAGEYPKVKSVRVVKQGTGEAASDAEPGQPAGNGQRNGKLGTRDVHIIRMTCLKAAACLLQNSGLNADGQMEQVTRVAEHMEQWVVRHDG